MSRIFSVSEVKQFSLHLPVSIHFPTVGKSHLQKATDPGESELLVVSDCGVTDKGSYFTP